MRRLFVLIVPFLLILPRTEAGEQASTEVTLFPAGLHLRPYRANIHESRIGLFKFLDASHMRVDIGSTIDLISLDVRAEDLVFRAGIDFMALGFVTGAQGLRLQIDAVDGLFGGNISASRSTGDGRWEARLRILHHSAHLVDGHYSLSRDQWIDGRKPVPYTRDFGELIIGRTYVTNALQLRTYAGGSYATLIRPVEIERTAYLGGIECAADHILPTVLDEPVNLFLAYQLTMTGTPVYAATHQIQAGCKIGPMAGKGVGVYVGYYAGQSMFGEYYNARIATIGAGFSVDVH